MASRQERAMNPAQIAALDALDLLVVVDNEKTRYLAWEKAKK